MKKLIVALSIVSLFACKKAEEEQQDTEPGIIETVQNVNKMSKAADELKDYEKTTEKLKAMTPVANAVFKEVLVEELGGLKRNNFNAGNASMVGLSSADARYGDQNDKNVKIAIYDGAGEAGSAMIAMTHMAISMNMESINGTNTKKTEEVDGETYLTESDTDPNSYKSASVNFIYKDRFNVSFDAQKMTLEELKSFIKKVDLSALEQ